MAVAKFKTDAVILSPIASAAAPNGSLFLDSGDGDALKTKGTGGGVDPLTSGATNLFVKQMEASAAIVVNRPVAKLANGKIVAADSDGVTSQEFIGYALQAAAADGDLINVLTVGANITGAVTGLGFAPGDEVYLSEDGTGYTNDANSFTGDNDSIIKVGIADCAAGTASVTAVDLIIFAEVIVRPV